MLFGSNADSPKGFELNMTDLTHSSSDVRCSNDPFHNYTVLFVRKFLRSYNTRITMWYMQYMEFWALKILKQRETKYHFKIDILRIIHKVVIDETISLTHMFVWRRNIRNCISIQLTGTTCICDLAFKFRYDPD